AGARAREARAGLDRAIAPRAALVALGLGLVREAHAERLARSLLRSSPRFARAGTGTGTGTDTGALRAPGHGLGRGC
ncbi:MAG: hypothetical protein AB7O84_22205, partial [Planctomycetota bacterium]